MPVTPAAAQPESTPEAAPAPTVITPEGPAFDVFQSLAPLKSPDPAPADAADPASDFPAEISDAPAAKAKWGELRKELAAARAKAQELESKVRPELESKLETYEKKVSEYERELAISRIEATPEYKATVTAPLEQIIVSAEALAKHYKVDAGRLVDAFAEMDPAKQTEVLGDLVDGMSERDRARIYRMADDAAAIYQKDEEIRANAATTLSEVEARQKGEAEKTERARSESLKKATDRVWKMVVERTPDLGVDLGVLRKDVMSVDPSKATPDALAYAASAGALLPHAVKALAAKDARIKELEGALKSYRKSSESGGSSAPTDSPSNNPIMRALFDRA